MPGELSYLKSLLIGGDQLINALCGGWPDETISSRAYRWEMGGQRSWPRKLIDLLFFWEADHCRESYASERMDRQLPPELRMMEGIILQTKVEELGGACSKPPAGQDGRDCNSGGRDALYRD